MGLKFKHDWHSSLTTPPFPRILPPLPRRRGKQGSQIREYGNLKKNPGIKIIQKFRIERVVRRSGWGVRDDEVSMQKWSSCITNFITLFIT